MMNTETLESGLNDRAVSATQDELVELGNASRETRGLFFGFFSELSILPLRLFW